MFFTIPLLQRNAVKLKMAKILFMFLFYAVREEKKRGSTMHTIKDSENQSMDVYFVLNITDHRSDEQYLFESVHTK